MKPHTATTKIGYLVKTFPKISETFILREVLALQDQGVDLQIFALRRPEEARVHAITSQVRAKIVYLPASFLEQPAALLWAQLILILFHPWAILRALRFVAKRPESGRRKDFLQAAYLAWQLMRHRIEHLHVHFINEPAGVGEIASMLIGMPFSITAHAKDIYLSPPSDLSRKMARAKFIVTCNDYNRNILSQLAAGTTPVVKIYHGLDAEFFQANGALHGADAVPVILSVGRLREKKGFRCLLDACHLLNLGGHKFRCVIVGYGPLRQDLERRIAELGLEEMVSLTGMLTQDEVIALYRQATLFVLPCQITADGDRDGIPNVLAEAMAMELPVISTNVSGIPELIEHLRNGLLVRPEDSAGLAAAISRLFDQPRWREKLGRAGRQTVCAMFSARTNAAQLESLFSNPPAAFREEPILAATAGGNVGEKPVAMKRTA